MSGVPSGMIDMDAFSMAKGIWPGSGRNLINNPNASLTNQMN